jgi:hypothetical protein
MLGLFCNGDKNMPNVTIVLTSQEFQVLLGTVGAMLNVMGLNVPPGQPATPQMVELEALQAKLMNLVPGRG